MLIDDDPNIRDVLTEFLRELDHEVAPFALAENALAALQSGMRPSLILLDLMMPGMDGPAFLRAVASAGLADFPVVLITAAGRNAAAGLPVAQVLAKPFRLDDLLAAIEAHSRPA